MQKHDIRVTALIISIGAIMMLGTLFFSIEYSRREAQKTMDRNISEQKVSAKRLPCLMMAQGRNILRGYMTVRD